MKPKLRASQPAKPIPNNNNDEQFILSLEHLRKQRVTSNDLSQTR